MSAVQEAIGQRENRLRRLIKWPWCWPLLTMPTSLIVYILAVLGCDLALTGWELAGPPPRAAELILFAALLGAAVVCIEAMRRLGQPSGVSRDLLSAWWLPIALLLPPLYALIAPLVIGGFYTCGRAGYRPTAACSAPPRSDWRAPRPRSRSTCSCPNPVSSG